MSKTPPPSPLPPPLLPNEFARTSDGQVQVRSKPARLRWEFNDLVTADGHRLRCAFACGLKPLADAAEKKLLGETLLGRNASASVDEVNAFFAPSLRATAVNVAATRKVADWLADGSRDVFADALRKGADKVAFGCGLEVLPPFEVSLESPTYQQAKLEAMERNLAEQRVAGQVEHFEKAASLLRQFDALRQAAPGISPGEVLAQISPSEQGAMLQTLLLAAGKGKVARDLWAVAGPSLVRIDPRVAPPKLELTPLPTDLGPLRSVQPAEIEGIRVLLIGARSGVMVFNPESPGSQQMYADPEIHSQMGFSRAIAWRDGVWGCHGDAGIVGWELGNFSRPRTVLRPTNLSPTPPVPGAGSQSIQMNKAAHRAI